LLEIGLPLAIFAILDHPLT